MIAATAAEPERHQAVAAHFEEDMQHSSRSPIRRFLAWL